MTNKQTEQSLAFECELAEPPAQVWRALTEPELLAAWLMPNDFQLELAREFTFRSAEREIVCEVLAFEQARMLRLRWCELPAAQPGLDSIVEFTLTPTHSGGTRLSIVHSESGARAVGEPLPFIAFGPAGRDTFRCAA
jgi:uncharacterized protein YndB with AHSA1/START domain